MKRSLLTLTGIFFLGIAFSLSAAEPAATPIGKHAARPDSPATATGTPLSAAVVTDLTARATQSRTVTVKKDKVDAWRQKNEQSLRTRQSQPTHCRYDVINGVPKVWWILKATPTDFVNLTTPQQHDYEIIYSNIVPAGSPIAIETGDQIVIKSGATVSLEHYDSAGLPKPNNPGSPKLTAGSRDLWVQGDAHAPSGNVVGTYYLYKLDDRSVCKHRNSTGAPCRQIHVEFFLNSLTTWRPVDGITILPISDPKCLEGQLETDDGDGDEGLR